MRCIIAKDPVSQARFLPSNMGTLFREVVGMVPPRGKSLIKLVLQKMTNLPENRVSRLHCTRTLWCVLLGVYAVCSFILDALAIERH